MRFEQRIEVKVDVPKVWEFLWDVERLARCLPGCQEAREIEPQQKYEVVVEERIGPFKARFEMDVNVVEMDKERRVRLLAVGKDKKLGASTRTELDVQLEAMASGGTALEIVAEIQVVGRIASLGQVPIKRKAQDVVQRFAKAIQAELESELVR